MVQVREQNLETFCTRLWLFPSPLCQIPPPVGAPIQTSRTPILPPWWPKARVDYRQCKNLWRTAGACADGAVRRPRRVFAGISSPVATCLAVVRSNKIQGTLPWLSYATKPNNLHKQIHCPWAALPTVHAHFRSYSAPDATLIRSMIKIINEVIG